MKIEVPCLMICAEGDPVLPPALADGMDDTGARRRDRDHRRLRSLDPAGAAGRDDGAHAGLSAGLAAVAIASGAMDDCIITCAMSGVAANRDQCPAIPYTPEEYAAEAKRARDAGASVVHIHARYPDGSPSYRVEEYRAITQAILAEAPDLIINYSTGAVGVPIEERVHQITALKPELGALNMGSMNYAKYSSKRKSLIFDFVFANPFYDITFLAREDERGRSETRMRVLRHRSHRKRHAVDRHGLDRTADPVLADHGGAGRCATSARNLAHMASILPEPSTWEVIGISREQWKVVAAAASLGGNVRVGLEDNFYLPSGEMASSNGDLIAAAAELIELSGRKVADPATARRLLSLPDPPDRTALESFTGSRLERRRVRRRRRNSVSEEVLAEMVANVWKVLVAAGDDIEEGDTICILESMKMEIPVESTVGGKVSEVNVTEGGVVQEGDVIAVID